MRRIKGGCSSAVPQATCPCVPPGALRTQNRHTWLQRRQIPVSQYPLPEGCGRSSAARACLSLQVSDQHQEASTSASPWHPLEEPLLWQGSEADAMRVGEVPACLSVPWKLLLLSDGSPTRHLHVMLGAEIEVDCFEMQRIGAAHAGLPEETSLLEGPLLQRQVFLRSPAHAAGTTGAALVYAASWWPAAQARAHLSDASVPIWKSLTAARRELYRDMRRLYLGHSPFLERKFGTTGPFWARHYVFWHGGRPLTLIYEAFSPALDQCFKASPQSNVPAGSVY